MGSLVQQARIGLAPQISIGMPVYNGEAFICEAIDSLLGQTYSDFELIISDNASTDATEAICKQYALKDQRIRYVRHEKNRGVSQNFQFVLDEAKGEYFMWAAADDVWGSNFIKDNLFFLKSRADYVGSISQSLCHTGESGIIAGSTCIENTNAVSRAVNFLQNPANNARFYSLFRLSEIKASYYASEGAGFLGGDWAVMISVLLRGKLNCIDGPPQFYKRAGSSANLVQLMDASRNRLLERIIPLYCLGKVLYNLGVFSGKPLPTIYYFVKHNARHLIAYWFYRLRILNHDRGL